MYIGTEWQARLAAHVAAEDGREPARGQGLFAVDQGHDGCHLRGRSEAEFRGLSGIQVRNLAAIRLVQWPRPTVLQPVLRKVKFTGLTHTLGQL